MTGAEWLGLAICLALCAAVAYITDLHDKNRRKDGRG